VQGMEEARVVVKGKVTEAVKEMVTVAATAAVVSKRLTPGLCLSLSHPTPPTDPRSDAHRLSHRVPVRRTQRSHHAAPRPMRFGRVDRMVCT
jgi:hypothetical protein